MIRHLSLSIVASPAGADDRGAYFPLTRLIIRLVKVVLDQVAAGRIQIPGIHPETVSATPSAYLGGHPVVCPLRRLPVPSRRQLLAFKGIKRVLRPDADPRVNRGDDPCDERPGADLLSGAAQRRLDPASPIMRVRSARLAYWRPKILTRENYIVTVPNAVVVGGKIINPQRRKRRRWSQPHHQRHHWLRYAVCQVHALLELAARRTLRGRSANCAGGA